MRELGILALEGGRLLPEVGVGHTLLVMVLVTRTCEFQVQPKDENEAEASQHHGV